MRNVLKIPDQRSSKWSGSSKTRNSEKLLEKLTETWQLMWDSEWDAGTEKGHQEKTN